VDQVGLVCKTPRRCIGRKMEGMGRRTLMSLGPSQVNFCWWMLVRWLGHGGGEEECGDVRWFRRWWWLSWEASWVVLSVCCM
jgi:hypothetical protein